MRVLACGGNTFDCRLGQSEFDVSSVYGRIETAMCDGNVGVR